MTYDVQQIPMMFSTTDMKHKAKKEDSLKVGTAIEECVGRNFKEYVFKVKRCVARYEGNVLLMLCM